MKGALKLTLLIVSLGTEIHAQELDSPDEYEETFYDEDGKLMYAGEDGYLYTDMGEWQEATFEMVKSAFPKERVWKDELTHDESPIRSFVRDDMVLLFGEDWGNDIFIQWEEDVDFEEEQEEISALSPPVVDKYFQNMMDIVNDPDCMEGEVDMASPNFSVERAVQMWHKCHILVIRNVFANAEGLNVVDEFRANVTKFVYDINQGHVNASGTTTYSEPMFLHDTDVNRWDMLLPKSLANHPYVLAPDLLVQVLEDERVLGEFKALSFGLVMAEAGASSQIWHQDERPMFGDGSIFHQGHGGHEHPAIQMVALAPLINMTRAHGPTELCVGSSAVNGLFTDRFDLMTWKDQNLKEQVLELIGDHPMESFLYEYCPDRMWRSPLLNAGDMILWDYNLNHRAGPNESKDFRSAMYTSYSRRMVQDRTFESFEDQPGNQPRNSDGSVDSADFIKRSIRKGRFALIETPNSLPKDAPSSVPSNTETILGGLNHEQQCLDGQCQGAGSEKGAFFTSF